jgi:CheY-like chemotaxis protein
VPNILIVDDDATNRAMYARLLREVGEIELACDGAEALRLLSARKYEVILLDLHMPGVDGLTVLNALESRPGLNHDTPIYVITADTTDQSRNQALGSGAICYLTKPVPMATLLAFVSATLKNSAARARITKKP